MALLLDISGLEALFQVNYKPLVISSYRVIRDKDIAEDIVQSVFIDLWENRRTVAISTSLKAYLFESTIDQSLNYIKKIKDVSAPEELYSAETEANVDSVEQALALRETGKRVDDAIGLLPLACRTIFVLSRYEQMRYRDIAKKLDLSQAIVRAQMTMALKHLRRCLLLSISLLFLTFPLWIL